MNVVFVLGSFYPNGSAVGNCVLNVALELVQTETVTVICKSTSLDIERRYRYAGINIVRVDTFLTRLRLKLENLKTTGNYIVRNISKINLFLLKFTEFSARLFMWKLFDGIMISNYGKTIKSIHREENIDILVPCASPFEACVASMAFKEDHPMIKLVPYMFDTLVGNSSFYRNSYFLGSLFRAVHLKLENKLLSKSDRVICMQHYFNVISKNHSVSSNLFKAEHPLIVQNTLFIQKNASNEKIKLIFTGALYRKIRNPSFVLSVLEELFKNIPKIEAHFYGGGDCKKILEDFRLSYPENFFHYGIVTLSEAKKAQLKATALLSIGNSTNFQLPSKTFEYMSSLKPIIHFAKNSNDSSIDILKKYPNHLIINEKTTQCSEALESIISFLISPKKSITFDDLRLDYTDALPSHTASLILNSKLSQKC